MGEENSTPNSNLGNPADETEAGGAQIKAAAEKAEERMCIGPYVLVKILGEGGMGQVWLAEQTTPVKRQVALKLIKGGLYDNSVVQRFESERQSLAVMNHPAIAKVFDAGSAKDGTPYFVMEYVNGLPITRYCDNHKLKIRERIGLFIRVCQGVQHAHQKAIIHRDLKPSNVLVEEVDGKPGPRIIDFGIAKAISSQRSAEQTMFTQAGALVGTPGFMSPEQADPNVLDVDTRTDVYSLGMIFYVMLTGTLPFDLEQMKKRPVDEVLRQLREEDPLKPSTKLELDKEGVTSTAESRGTEPRHLVRLLHGDLDWITLKAIEKDRARRYGTPSELAADLERYLENKPVVARPASPGYRLRKYVRRHRVGVTIGAALVLLLAAFAFVQAVQLRRITRERDRATRITDFMTNMFKVSDPSQARGNTITAREILDQASNEIDSGLGKDPELQVHMMGVMGNVYQELGLYSRAQSLLERAQEIAHRALGVGNQETSKSATLLSWVLAREGRYADAEKLERETMEHCRRAFGPKHTETLAAMSNLGWILFLEGHYPEAEKLDREALDARRRLSGPGDANTLGLMNNLAGVLYQEGRYAEAEDLDRHVLEIRRRVLGPEHPDTLKTLNNLSTTLQEEGHYAEAEEMNREVLEIRRRVLGPEHPLTLTSMSNLADVYGDDGKYAEAEQIDRQVLDLRRRLLGPEHPETLTSMDNLAFVLFHEDHFAEAEKLAKQAGDTRRRVLGPEHPETALSTYTLACIALRQGQRYKALFMLRQAVDHGLAPNVALDMEKDPDLKALRSDPGFEALLAHAKQRTAAQSKQN